MQQSLNKTGKNLEQTCWPFRPTSLYPRPERRGFTDEPDKTLIEAEVTAAYQARLATEDAEWTREVTQQRRQAWNDWVRSQGATMHPATLAAHGKEIGYDMLLLARQIKRHGL